MNVAVETGGWTPGQLAAAAGPATARLQRTASSLRACCGELARLPPIVVSWEIDQLKDELASAQRGERFLLQGGDCAESFADCDSDTIARKLKILLQMSVVLLHGLQETRDPRRPHRRPVCAKPRSGRVRRRRTA